MLGLGENVLGDIEPLRRRKDAAILEQFGDLVAIQGAYPLESDA